MVKIFEKATERRGEGGEAFAALPTKDAPFDGRFPGTRRLRWYLEGTEGKRESVTT